ncbi:unnamed protein product [Medioppia subpectinata]|uniref:C2H2-type domain-containing protein n=1 Tax=Medioppia subpectinata TaxID=1979941 RepID=A0A7R9LP02_9ACAR|nr:unnamed protein product [Medioppia subpectinata]CAG2120144.1 unnamed protein product [Medioppia subpectinata]
MTPKSLPLNASTDGLNTTETNTQLMTVPVIVCPISGCDLMFMTLELLEQHLTTHSFRSKQLSRSKQSKRKTVSNAGQSQTPGAAATDLLRCPHESCRQRGFKHSRNLIAHTQRQHSTHEPYVCDEDNCRKRFPTRKGLLRHKSLSHEKGRLFVCPHSGCGKAFTKRWSYSEHITRHSTHTPFACTHTPCEHRFATKKLLELHVRRVH